METWAEVRRRVLAGDISKRQACRAYHLKAHPHYRAQRQRLARRKARRREVEAQRRQSVE